jgi:hypothetical protein
MAELAGFRPVNMVSQLSVVCFLGERCRGTCPGVWRILDRFGLRCGGLFRSIRTHVDCGVSCRLSRDQGEVIFAFKKCA